MMSSRSPPQTDAEPEPIKFSDPIGINRSNIQPSGNSLYSSSGGKNCKSSSSVASHSSGYSSVSEINLVSASYSNIQSARPFSDENKLLYSDYLPYFKDEKLKEDNCDILIIHAEKDLTEAKQFKEHLQKDIVLHVNKKSLRPRVKLLQEFIVGSSFEYLDFAFSKSLYVFLYVTKEFCDCTWSLLQGQACLTEAIRDLERKWCVIPVHTRSRKNQNYKLPMMLGSLRPINYWKEDIDQFYTEGVRKLLDSKLAVLLHRDQMLEEDRSKYFELNKEQILLDCAYHQKKSSYFDGNSCSSVMHPIQVEADHVSKLVSISTNEATFNPTKKDLMGATDSGFVEERAKQITLNENQTIDYGNSLKVSFQNNGPLQKPTSSDVDLSNSSQHCSSSDVIGPLSTENISPDTITNLSSLAIDGPANIEIQSPASRVKSPISHEGSRTHCVPSASSGEPVKNAVPLNLPPGGYTHSALSVNTFSSGGAPNFYPVQMNCPQMVMGLNGALYVTTQFGYHLVSPHMHSMQPGVVSNSQPLPYHLPFPYNPYMSIPNQQPSSQPSYFALQHSNQLSSTSESAQSSIQANVSSVPSQFISGSVGYIPPSITPSGFYNPYQTTTPWQPGIVNPGFTQHDNSVLSNRGDFTNIKSLLAQPAGGTMSELNSPKAKTISEPIPVDAAGDKASDSSPISPSAVIAPVVQHIHHHHHKKEIRVENATNVLIGDQSKFINNSTVHSVHAEMEHESTDEDESFEQHGTGLKTNASRLERPSSQSADCIHSMYGVETSVKDLKKEPVEQSVGYPECPEPVTTREPIEASNDEADDSSLIAQQHQTYAKVV
ncbi:unnamed protein product [Lymnaea stagnalis]|uniref:TIR domain-containing protein n=1 Tax=Lymnaea stagnalis TaxID=6523 RepID=A0AAV2H0Z1_LYMST